MRVLYFIFLKGILAIQNTQSMSQVVKVEIFEGKHHQKQVIWISFAYDKELIVRLKSKFPKARWSFSQKKWFLPDTSHYRQLLQLPPKDKTADLLKNIHPINHAAVKRYIETLKLRAYSESTIRTYTNEFCQLLHILKNCAVDSLDAERLRSYFFYCINELKLSENLIHSRMNAVKFYFEQVLHREKFFFDIPRPKKPSALPKVFSTRDIQKLFDVTTNPKHKLMLQLCYGMGLRVSEIVNLRLQDIDTGRMQVLVANAKGKKDRYVNLPKTTLPTLKTYYHSFKPKVYLFEGENGGQFAIRTVQHVFKTAMQKAKIKKPVGIHSLRHSYATHLLEYGTDVTFIKELLGHNDVKTTMRYTHVATKTLENIISPLDKM